VAQDEDLSPATREEVISTLSFALRFAGRKRVHHGDDFMARIAAEHLADHLGRVCKRRTFRMHDPILMG